MEEVGLIIARCDSDIGPVPPSGKRMGTFVDSGGLSIEAQLFCYQTRKNFLMSNWINTLRKALNLCLASLDFLNQLFFLDLQ